MATGKLWNNRFLLPPKLKQSSDGCGPEVSKRAGNRESGRSRSELKGGEGAVSINAPNRCLAAFHLAPGSRDHPPGFETPNGPAWGIRILSAGQRASGNWLVLQSQETEAKTEILYTSTAQSLSTPRLARSIRTGILFVFTASRMKLATIAGLSASADTAS
jgi:hypothetical protein